MSNHEISLQLEESYINWTFQQRIDPAVKAEWIEALLSEKYKDKQGRRVLVTPEGNFCCLGVYCDMKGLPSQVRIKEYPNPEAPGGWSTAPLRTFFNSDEEIQNGLRGTVTYIPYARAIPTFYADGSAAATFNGFETLWTSWEQGSEGQRTHFRPFNLPHLNDEGFTFAQIADVIRYFL